MLKIKTSFDMLTKKEMLIGICPELIDILIGP